MNEQQILGFTLCACRWTQWNSPDAGVVLVVLRVLLDRAVQDLWCEVVNGTQPAGRTWLSVCSIAYLGTENAVRPALYLVD